MQVHARFFLLYCLLLLLLPFAAAAADSQLPSRLPSRLDSDASSDQPRNSSQQRLPNADSGARRAIIIDGKPYPIQDNVDDLGRALYVSIQQQHWADVEYYLAKYQTLANADALLLAYARGALARIRGDMQQAASEYRKLLALRPDFFPGQLELARVLFADHQNQQATMLFAQIADQLDPSNTKHANIISSVENFTEALQRRHTWQSSVAVGSIWTDNLNHSSQSYTCFVSFRGQCYSERQTPDAISARGVDYQLTLNRQVSISGQHGVYFRAQLSAQRYQDYPDYHQTIMTNQIGYAFENYADYISLAPEYEFLEYGDATYYRAWGLHAQWRRKLSRTRMFKLAADYKKHKYADQQRQRLNSSVYSLNFSAWQMLADNWMLISGVDWLEITAKATTESYNKLGLRFGASKQFAAGIQVVLLTSASQRSNHNFSKILGAKRNDIVKDATLTVTAAKLAIAGFTPTITLNQRSTRSNIDWLYSNQKNQINLKLTRNF